MNGTRGVWLAIALLASAILGEAGGVLAWLGGLRVEAAILTGCGTFVGSTSLLLTILAFLTNGQRV